MAICALGTLLLSALALSSCSANGISYGRGYGYVGAPHRRVLVKAVPVKRIAYGHKRGGVYRSAHDSYDERDALRTADSDVHHRLVHAKPVHKVVHKAVHEPVHTAVHEPVHKTVFVPPYPPAPVEKTVHVPLHAAHDEHVAHVAHVDHAPYHYDPHVVPECALVNHLAYNVTACLDDAAYPTDYIIHELKKNPELTDRLMSDVTYQSADNLVDGLTKAEEESYSRQHYFGLTDRDHLTHADGHAYGASYQEQGGYICPSDIFYGRVKRAVNTFGEWKVIVNLPDNFRHDPKYKKYVQTSRLESCVYPGAACSFVDHLFPSACLQKYSFVRLVAYSYDRGLHVDSFKLPSACSCHVSPRPVPY
ncbi:uncharacterized protein LOC122374794 [Amphibalanus amphitrite]|uniref:uncharacterized protein LOC122374794 n=1 Tax=Amphibalanus amphitrite TaxID=1232801 RepID=UPI001C9282A9|nr:uncharacterized protein LOC122374794 [Amphibalanus amphitrite]